VAELLTRCALVAVVAVLAGAAGGACFWTLLKREAEAEDE
jgi:hypothetical protein